MSELTPRLSLHKIELGTEHLGDYFPILYSADLQKLDDEVQIKNLAAAGKIPVYGAGGLLESSGVAPEDLEVGLVDTILTDQGMLLFRNATQLAALSPGVSGKSLLTQGVGANPVFGYPSHSTLTDLLVGDSHTQYVLRSLLTARGAIPYKGASAWVELAKGTLGYVLMQGADDPYWGLPKLDDMAAPDDNTDLNASTEKHGLMQKLPGTAQTLKGDGSWITRTFDIGYPFGNGVDVITDGRMEFRAPIACKIVAARVRETSDVTGSIACTLYKRTYAGTWSSALDVFSIAANTKYEETGLNIAIDAGDWVSIRVSGITAVKQILCSLTCEAT